MIVIARIGALTILFPALLHFTTPSAHADVCIAVHCACTCGWGDIACLA